MKKLLTLALAFVVAISSQASDNDKNSGVSRQVKSSFAKEFPTAVNTSWETIESGIAHVRFIYNGQVMDAYFNSEAELISIVREISKEQLPLLVSKTVTEKFKDASVYQITECVMNGETSYFITAADQSKSVIARVYTNGGVEILKKSKKS